MSGAHQVRASRAFDRGRLAVDTVFHQAEPASSVRLFYWFSVDRYAARWPGKAPAGATSETRFCSIDLLPTLAAIKDGQVPAEVDGMDLSAAFKDTAKIDRGTLYWHYPHYHQAKPSGSILKGEWKLIEWFETGETELYHLAADPEEKRKLAAAIPEWNAELLADLTAWRQRVGAQMMQPNPDPDPTSEHLGEERRARKKGNSKSENEEQE